MLTVYTYNGQYWIKTQELKDASLNLQLWNDKMKIYWVGFFYELSFLFLNKLLIHMVVRV